MAKWKCVAFTDGKAKTFNVNANDKPAAYKAAREKIAEMEKRGKIGAYSILDSVALVRE